MRRCVSDAWLLPGKTSWRLLLSKAASALPYGAGIQNKVLEAMACGTPVVASPQACIALRAQDGEHLMITEGAKDFAQAVLGLLDDARRCGELGQAGRRYVEEDHDWGSIAGQLENVYAQVGAKA